MPDATTTTLSLSSRVTLPLTTTLLSSLMPNSSLAPALSVLPSASTNLTLRRAAASSFLGYSQKSQGQSHSAVGFSDASTIRKLARPSVNGLSKPPTCPATTTTSPSLPFLRRSITPTPPAGSEASTNF